MNRKENDEDKEEKSAPFIEHGCDITDEVVN